MTRRLLLFFAVLLPLQSPNYSKFEKQFKFKWDKQLQQDVKNGYGKTDRYFNRLAQVYAESAFNPRATSDFRGWKKAKLDTATAIRKRMGAAGLAQFVYPTARDFGVQSVNPCQAGVDTLAADIYNPRWNLDAYVRYMKEIERILMTTKNPKARRKLQTDKNFLELCATASYNTGQGRIKSRLNKYEPDWRILKNTILPEPRDYAEKIKKYASEMEKEKRWGLNPQK